MQPLYRHAAREDLAKGAGDASRNQLIVACVQIEFKFALRSVTRSGKRLKFPDRKDGRVV
jgi:hypothetical protein